MCADEVNREATETAPAEAAVPLPLYELGWQPVTLRAASNEGRSIVVLAGDDEALLGLLAREAQACGLRGAVLGPARESAGTETHGSVLPADSAGWAAFWTARPSSDQVSVVLAMKASPLPESLPESLDGQHDVAARGAMLCANVTAAVAGLDRSAVPGSVFVVTRGARQVTGRDAVVAGDHGLLQGLAPMLGLEFSGTWGGVVDLPAEPGPADVAALLRLVLHGGGEDLAAVRDGELLVGRLREATRRRNEQSPIREDATYVVTGGLGGIGRALVSDFVRRGARHLLLIGRTPREQLGTAATALLDRLHSQGVDARYHSADCDDAAALATVCRTTDTMPAVRGVVHGAGVASHQPLAEADAESFTAALRGKFTGAWWLHLLSHDWPLDFFVHMSSASALWGIEGYGAYAAANGGLDALAAHRAAAGLAGISIAFGPWELDGMADAVARDGLARIGVGAFTPASGCASFTAAAQVGAPLVVACPVDWPLFSEVMATRRRRPLFADVAPPRQLRSTSDVSSAAPGDAALLMLSEQARPAAAREHVGRLVAAVLGHTDGHAVREDTGFFQLGLTSIMAVDLRRRLSATFGVELRISAIFDHPTVAELAGHIVDLIPTVAPASLDTVRPAGAAAPPRHDPSAQGPVAIVGMAGRFPGADSVDELWELLREGRDGVGPIPSGRWDSVALQEADPLGDDRAATNQGGFLRDIARFDAAFFDIPAREAENLDPQQRLLLESAWHAIEDGVHRPDEPARAAVPGCSSASPTPTTRAWSSRAAWNSSTPTTSRARP